MKKIIVFLVSLLLLLLISSCGQPILEEEKNNISVDNRNSKIEVKEDMKEENDILLMNNEVKPVEEIYEDKIAFEAYSSFKKSEMIEKVNNMKDSTEKFFVLTKMNNFKEASDLNRKLSLEVDKNHKVKLSFILKDMEGKVIKGAKVKNLITDEEIISDINGKGLFSDDFIFPAKIPVFIEKEGYSSYAYTYNLNSLDEGKKVKNAIINLKKAQIKIINYNGNEQKVLFSDKSEVILSENSIIIEGTDKKYTGKVKVQLTSYKKDEVLSNETLRSSLDNAYLDDEETVALDTFGMIDINLYGEDGEKLNINNTSTIKIPVSDIEKAKEEFNIDKTGKTKNGFWYLDKTTGSWINLKDGILDLENKVYIAEVEHFSVYNFDHAFKWKWIGPNYSTNEKIWKNGKNKVEVTMKLDIISGSYKNYSKNDKIYRHTFYNNGEWTPKKECKKYCGNASSNPPTAKVTWFTDDIVPPEVTGEIDGIINNTYGLYALARSHPSSRIGYKGNQIYLVKFDYINGKVNNLTKLFKLGTFIDDKYEISYMKDKKPSNCYDIRTIYRNTNYKNLTDKYFFVSSSENELLSNIKNAINSGTKIKWASNIHGGNLCRNDNFWTIFIPNSRLLSYLQEHFGSNKTIVIPQKLVKPVAPKTIIQKLVKPVAPRNN